MRAGYIAAFVVVGAAFAAAIGWVIYAGVIDDRSDAYGRVGIPGRSAFDLPADEIVIYYEERRPGYDSDTDSLTPPPGLRIVVRGPGAKRIPLEASADAEIAIGDLVRTDVSKFQAPEAGRFVVGSPTAVPGADSPSLVLGESTLKRLLAALYFFVPGLGIAGLIALVTWIRSAADVRPAQTPGV